MGTDAFFSPCSLHVNGSSSAADALSVLLSYGVVFLDHAVAVPLIDACRPLVDKAILQLDAKLAAEGCSAASRTRFKVRASKSSMVESPMGDERLSVSASWLPLIHAALGANAKELWRGVLDNRPGSHDQEWHRDGNFLEKCADADAMDCLTVFVPLIEASMAHGPTEFLPGSHFGAALYETGIDLAADGELPVVSAEGLPQGSAIIFDFRTVHRGRANTTGLADCTNTACVVPQVQNRPMLYVIYGRALHDKDHGTGPGTTSYEAV